MNLWMYEGKKIKLTSITGRTYVGIADIYHEAEDNESELASLSVEMADGAYIDFDEPEIASIEIIEATIQSLAVAV